MASFFSGAGFADVGYKAAGFTPVYALEYIPEIAEVYRLNLGDHIVVGDVRDADFSHLKGIDLLHTSPVCTRASTANPNATEHSLDIECGEATARGIHQIRPRWFALENVYKYQTFESFKIIVNQLEKEGYKYIIERINCADVGVPQTRKRLILRASLDNQPTPLPLTHKGNWQGWYAAIEDLIPDLPECKLAPWQVSRLPKHLKDNMLLDCKNGARTEEKGGPTLRATADPCFTIGTDSVGSHCPKALLVGNGRSTASGTVLDEHCDPSYTITARTLEQGTRAIIAGGVTGHQVAGTAGNYQTNLSCVPMDLPSPTVSCSQGSKQAVRAVLIAGGNANNSQMTRKDEEPAWCDAPGNGTALAQRIVDSVRVVQISPRCLLRFQSGPDSYLLPESRKLSGRIIGNGVPPLLAQRIGESFLRQ